MDIIIIGFSNSGKSTMANYLAEKYNFKVYEISKYVMLEFVKQSDFKMPVDFCDNYYENNKLSYFTIKMLEDVLLEEEKRIFVGPRSSKEIKLITDSFKSAILVGVVADFDIRNRRFEVSRMRKHKNKELKERDIIESKWGLSDELINQCDSVIYNMSSINDFYYNIDKEMNKWK